MGLLKARWQTLPWLHWSVLAAVQFISVHSGEVNALRTTANDQVAQLFGSFRISARTVVIRRYPHSFRPSVCDRKYDKTRLLAIIVSINSQPDGRWTLRSCDCGNSAHDDLHVTLSQRHSSVLPRREHLSDSWRWGTSPSTFVCDNSSHRPAR